MSIHAILDAGVEADDAPLVVSEYWPTATNDNGHASNPHLSTPNVQASPSWWEQTNWFRVQERRAFEAQQRAQGMEVSSSPINSPGSDTAHPASLAVSHPLHDDKDAPVEYGGISEDGSQLGERYMGRAQQGIGAALSRGAPLTEQQRVALAPGGAEVFCRFNTSSSTSAPSVQLARTEIAVAASVPSGATSSPSSSLLARNEPTPKAGGAAKTSTAGGKQSSTRLRLASIQGYSGEVKSKLHELVVLPLFHPSLFSSVGVRASRGVILGGASGAGKSNLVKALVHELGHRVYFQHVDGAHLLTELQADLAAQKAADPRNLESTLGIHNSGTGLGAPQECGTDVLSKLFQACRKNAPALLFIDELDVVASERKQGEQPLLAKVRALLKLNMDRLSESALPVVVIGATGRPESLDPALLRTGRFDRMIQLNKPDVAGRLEILRHCTRPMRMDAASLNADLTYLASQTEGFVGADLANLCTEAGLVCIREFLHEQALARGSSEDGEQEEQMEDESNAASEQGVTPVPLGAAGSEADLARLVITRAHFREALKTIKPSSSRSFGELSLQPAQWHDIGGTKEIKQTLLETIEHPLRFPDLFAKFGIAPSSGCLMFGPPGCGKTLMARAIASRANASFLSVKGPELLSAYLGESEANVRKIFAQARASSPCVLFLDEVDSIALSRSSGHGGDATCDRVLNQILTEMDGRIMGGGDEPEEDEKQDTTKGTAAGAPAASPKKKKVASASKSPAPIVFVVAATNRPDLLDPALLRPGRLDQLLFVGLPNAESRFEILRTLLAQTPCAPEIIRDDYAVLREIAQTRTRGLSGADLAAVCNVARRAAINSFLHRSTQSVGASSKVPKQSALDLTPADVVTLSHLDRALSDMRPSVSAETMERYRLFNEQMQRGASITSVNDVVVDADAGTDSGASNSSSASSSSASASTPAAVSAADMSALRASFRADIAAKLAALGPGANAQEALNAFLASMLSETNRGEYKPSASAVAAVGTSSVVASSDGSSMADADAPVSLAAANASQVPARSRKTGGREK